MTDQKPVAGVSKKGWRIASCSLFLLTIFCYLFLVVQCGGSIWEYFRYMSAMGFLLLSGLRICQLCLPGRSMSQQLLLSLSFGLGLCYLSFISFGRIAPWMTVLPLCPLALWQILVFWKQRQNIVQQGKELIRHPALPSLLIIFSLLLFLNAFLGLLPYAHPSQAGPMVYHQDLFFSTGNAAAVQLGAPLADLRASGGRLCYHFLGDALPGFVAMFSGVLPYHAVCFYHDSFLLAMMVIGLYALGRAFGGSWKTAAGLSVAYLFFTGWETTLQLNILQNLNGLVIVTCLTAAVFLYLIYAEQQATDWKFYAAFSLSMLTLLMSKNVYGMLIGCALAAAVLFGWLVQKKRYRAGLILTILTILLTGYCWFTYFQYAFGALHLELWYPVSSLPAFFLQIMPVQLVLWGISIVLCLRRIRTLPFSRLVVHAGAVGSLAAFFLFDHYSASQYYFLLAGVLFIWVAALDLQPLFLQKKRLILLPLLLSLLLLPSYLKYYSHFGYEGFDILRRIGGGGNPVVVESASCTQEDQQAALWLHDHMEKDEIFATDRNDRNPKKHDGTWHYYSALSGRQCYMESWGFAMTYGHTSPEMHYKREEVSDVIFQSGDAEKAFALAKEHDIRYLLLYKPFGHPPLAGAEPVFENSRAAIYDVESPLI